MDEMINETTDVLETAEETANAWADDPIGMFQSYLEGPLLKVLVSAAIILFGFILLKVVLHIVRKALRHSPLDNMLEKFVCGSIKVVFVILLVMTLFSYLGIPMTPFVTMLGACGAAVALALKDSLGNFAGGILLIIHHPFKNGDFIECGGTVGRVQHISLLYTTLDAGGKTVSVPNGILANQTMINYSNEENRKIDCAFGISYDSDIEKAKQLICEVIAGAPYFDGERAPSVGVTNYCDSYVELSVYVWCSNDDYYDARYYLMEHVKEAFEREGIEFPFPQVVVHQAERIPKPAAEAVQGKEISGPATEDTAKKPVVKSARQPYKSEENGDIYENNHSERQSH